MGDAIPQKERTLTMTATIPQNERTLTMAAATSGGRPGGIHNAPCFGTMSWKERTLNDGRCDSPERTHPNDGSGRFGRAVGIINGRAGP